MLVRIFLIFFLIVGILSIGIPIRANQKKCMIVYSVGQTESTKIEAQFPQIPRRQEYEFYEISVFDTETMSGFGDIVHFGNYKKQLTLTPNVIYEICFTVRSGRDFGKVVIQYTAQNLFNVDHKEIKVPENLLKAGDFKVSYQSAEKLKMVTQNFKQLQVARKESQSTTFIQTAGINKWLIYISIGEIAIIILTAIYQFFSLQSFLTKKHLI